MSSREAVCVITPTYNRGRSLPRAIDGVLSQSCDPLEIEVVDDGPTGQTPGLLHGGSDISGHRDERDRGVGWPAGGPDPGG